jgi:hypothetical protein
MDTTNANQAFQPGSQSHCAAKRIKGGDYTRIAIPKGIEGQAWTAFETQATHCTEYLVGRFCFS